jgi:AcrR family transcriptional regulator
MKQTTPGKRLQCPEKRREQPPARERIILAAVDILEKEGAAGITTRRIAALAGVNSASVNYYFGSREKLLEQVMSLTLEHGFSDSSKMLEREEIPLPIRVFCVVAFLLEGIERYPGIVRSHLFEAASEQGSKRFLEAFEGFLDAAAAAVAGPGRRDQLAVRLSIGQMLSSAVFAGLVPGLVESLAGSREEFAANLVERFLGMDVRLTRGTLARMEAFRREAFDSFRP